MPEPYVTRLARKVAAAADAKKKKPRDPYANMAQVAHHSYTPIAPKRDLDPEEQQLIDQAKTNWMPRIFTSQATKLHELLASPGKQAVLSGLLGGGLGAGLGAAFGHKLGRGDEGSTLAGAGIGGLALGLPSALSGYWGRQAENDDIEEQMKRLPAGATLRDMMSDPVWQADANRAAMMAAQQGSGRFGSGMLTGAMLANS